AQFSTAKDMVFAQIIGNLKTIELVSGQMASNKEKALSQASPLKWTGQKVDLVELVYALQASGLINNGNVGIKDLATALEQLFNVEMGDYYRIFLEIRMRKSNQSKLLDFLKTSLHNRIIEVDG
ncbi:MAG TPA: transcriptional regulator, partial [Aequorivita sp.]|nr:transcriptional regulator [Aequorivita sp.]